MPSLSALVFSLPASTFLSMCSNTAICEDGFMKYLLNLTISLMTRLREHFNAIFRTPRKSFYVVLVFGVLYLLFLNCYAWSCLDLDDITQPMIYVCGYLELVKLLPVEGDILGRSEEAADVGQLGGHVALDGLPAV